MRYDGTTGAPLPAPGQTGATFVPKGSGGLQNPAQLILGPDGNLYGDSQTNNAVFRYDGTTGAFIDTFIRSGSGGLNNPRGLVFGPDGNLYIKCPSSVMRYDGTTGAPLPAPGQTGATFIHSGSGGLFTPHGQSFTSTDPTTLAYAHAPANRFVITAPATASAGTPFDVTVTALDPYGNSAPGYTGTVTFTSSDAHAILPADYTFTTADNGTHTFSGVTLVIAGAQTLTAQDTAGDSLTGSVTIGAMAAPADHFLIMTPASAIAGMLFDLTVTAQDPYGNLATGYTGTVTFASSDVQAALPAGYTFTAADNGIHTFPGVTLVTAGAQILTAQDTANSALTGSAAVTVVAAPANHFQIMAPLTAASDTPFDVTVTAIDLYGNVDTNYTGTVTWASSDPDPGVILSADNTLQARDNGTHTFSAGVTLITLGNQTVTITDTVSGITSTATITVSPSPHPPPGGGARRPTIPASTQTPFPPKARK